MAAKVISTVVVPALPAYQGQPAYDLIDLATVKDELSVTGGAKDATLKRYITQASAAAAKHANRVFPVETVQDLVFPDRDPNWQVARGTVDPLVLSRSPLVAQPCTAGTGAPPTPVLAAVAGGTLAAAGYFVRTTYVTPAGETAVSAEAMLQVAADNLLQVAAPGPDTLALATGWNVYVGTIAGQETLQNAQPLALSAAWLEPTGGLLAGKAMPSFVSVIENGVTLIEGVDFLTDFDDGALTRLSASTLNYPRHWPKLPISVLFPAGYVFSDPNFADAQDAVIRMVKGKYFAQGRDPALREENVAGAWQAQYWFGAGPGSSGALPPDIADLLEKYRVPVFA